MDRQVLMVELIGEVTFGCIEQRLDGCLVEHAENDRVALIHQVIANDIRSSSEMAG